MTTIILTGEQFIRLRQALRAAVERTLGITWVPNGDTIQIGKTTFVKPTEEVVEKLSEPDID